MDAYLKAKKAEGRDSRVYEQLLSSLIFLYPYVAELQPLKLHLDRLNLVEEWGAYSAAHSLAYQLYLLPEAANDERLTTDLSHLMMKYPSLDRMVPILVEFPPASRAATRVFKSVDYFSSAAELPLGHLALGSLPFLSSELQTHLQDRTRAKVSLNFAETIDLPVRALPRLLDQCGSCPNLNDTFRSTVLDRSSKKYGRWVEVFVGQTRVGLIKLEGDRSMISLVNARDPETGNYALLCGGVYGVHPSLLPSELEPRESKAQIQVPALVVRPIRWPDYFGRSREDVLKDISRNVSHLVSKEKSSQP